MAVMHQRMKRSDNAIISSKENATPVAPCFAPLPSHQSLFGGLFVIDGLLNVFFKKIFLSCFFSIVFFISISTTKTKYQSNIRLFFNELYFTCWRCEFEILQVHWQGQFVFWKFVSLQTARRNGQLLSSVACVSFIRTNKCKCKISSFYLSIVRTW